MLQPPDHSEKCLERLAVSITGDVKGICLWRVLFAAYVMLEYLQDHILSFVLLGECTIPS